MTSETGTELRNQFLYLLTIALPPNNIKTLV